MYRKSILLMTVLVCATILLSVFLHERSHRFDIVTVGAGGGGSSEEKGDAMTAAWLVDHQTGQVWSIRSSLVVPMEKIH